MAAKEELDFETFLDKKGVTLDEYLNQSAAVCYSKEGREAAIQRIEAIYAAYPAVAAVVDRYEPHALSREESEALIRLLIFRNEDVINEMREIYCKGCADSAVYLRKMGLLL